jgi:uncharacterized protein (TIGR02246 family)
MSDIAAELSAANDAFVAAFLSGDVHAVSRRYTPDGQLLPPGSDVITGHDAIEGYWRGVMAMGLGSLTLTSDEVERHGDTAIELGHYALGLPDGSAVDEGTYLVIWKKSDGGWRLHRDIWNTNRPG